jgi:hypothetical protein
MTYNYDTSFNNLLIKYLNPERETFQEFIFRDINGLYRYEGPNIGNLKKVYITDNTSELFSDTCKKLAANETDIIVCQKYLLGAIINFNNTEYTDIYKNIIIDLLKNNKSFFDIAKDNLKTLNANIVINILKNFNFKIDKVYNDKYNLELNTVENTVDWLSKIDKLKAKKSSSFIFLIKYLQTLVDYVNSNPALLNADFNEFESAFYSIKNQEEFLINNYNKNAIYNDIINANLDIIITNNTQVNTFIDNIKLKIKELDKLYYQMILVYQGLFKKISNKIEINDNNFFAKNLRIIKQSEDILYKNITLLLNYVKINPKNNEEFDLVTKTRQKLTFNNIEEQINTFILLKNVLRNTQDEFLLKYPKKNFFIYN